jgi:hypothetical protein
VHGPVDHDRAVVYGSTVDHGRRWPKGSSELALGADPVSRSSPAVGEKGKGARGVSTMGEGGRCSAVPEGGRRWWTKTAVGWSSLRCGLRNGEAKL